MLMDYVLVQHTKSGVLTLHFPSMALALDAMRSLPDCSCYDLWIRSDDCVVLVASSDDV